MELACMYLHKEEGDRIFALAYKIKTDFEELKKRLYDIPDNVKDWFEDADKNMAILYKPYKPIVIKDWVWDREAYDNCLNDLQGGIDRLEFQKQEITSERYNKIYKWAVACRKSLNLFRTDWDTINDYNRRTGVDNANRWRYANYHAFNEKKIHMDGLLHDLKLLASETS